MQTVATTMGAVIAVTRLISSPSCGGPTEAHRRITVRFSSPSAVCGSLRIPSVPARAAHLDPTCGRA